jgi:hypothetical protein
MIDFGDYVEIEQKRYGRDNEMFMYKVVAGGLRCNYWTPVPVDANNRGPERGEMADAVRAIRCGVCEDTVEIFRLQDVSHLNSIANRSIKSFQPI